MKVEEDRSRTSKSRRHATQGPAGLLPGYSCLLSRDAYYYMPSSMLKLFGGGSMHADANCMAMENSN